MSLNMLSSILLATFFDSLTGLLGTISLFFNMKKVEKFSKYLVAFAAGAMIGAAFLHLIPEAFEINIFAGEFLVVGFIFFFFLERIIHMRHCHGGKCMSHLVSWLVIIGDGFHNILDGLVIASSFLISPILGWTTTFAILAHEVPQEMGNFGILVHHGFSRNKAIIWTFISQTTCILGGLLGYFLGASLSVVLLPIAAGGFIYIAAVDLIPELNLDKKFKDSVGVWVVFISGILSIEVFKLLFNLH